MFVAVHRAPRRSCSSVGLEWIARRVIGSSALLAAVDRLRRRRPSRASAWCRSRRSGSSSAGGRPRSSRSGALAYLRFWLVQDADPARTRWPLFVGSPLYILYLRALGARIGAGVVVLVRDGPGLHRPADDRRRYRRPQGLAVHRLPGRGRDASRSGRSRSAPTPSSASSGDRHRHRRGRPAPSSGTPRRCRPASRAGRAALARLAGAAHRRRLPRWSSRPAAAGCGGLPTACGSCSTCWSSPCRSVSRPCCVPRLTSRCSPILCSRGRRQSADRASTCRCSRCCHGAVRPAACSSGLALIITVPRLLQPRAARRTGSTRSTASATGAPGRCHGRPTRAFFIDLFGDSCAIVHYLRALGYVLPLVVQTRLELRHRGQARVALPLLGRQRNHGLRWRCRS